MKTPRIQQLHTLYKLLFICVLALSQSAVAIGSITSISEPFSLSHLLGSDHINSSSEDSQESWLSITGCVTNEILNNSIKSLNEKPYATLEFQEELVKGDAKTTHSILENVIYKESTKPSFNQIESNDTKIENLNCVNWVSECVGIEKYDYEDSFKISSAVAVEFLEMGYLVDLSISLNQINDDYIEIHEFLNVCPMTGKQISIRKYISNKSDHAR